MKNAEKYNIKVVNPEWTREYFSKNITGNLKDKILHIYLSGARVLTLVD